MHPRRVFLLRHLSCVAALVCVLLPFHSADAQESKQEPAQIVRLRIGSHPTFTRLVFDVEDPVTVSHNLVKGPTRVLVDFKNARIGSEIAATSFDVGDGIIQKIVFHSNDAGGVSVEVFSQRITHYNVQDIPDPRRIVIDVYGKRQAVARLKPAGDAEPKPPSPTSLPAPSKQANGVPIRGTFQTIVIDAGHGGKDPGAIGRSGLEEKDVVLDIARRLRTLLVKNLGRTVVMTRDSDVFIPLGRRTQIANENNADLFVSIHANASPRRSTSGIEVYLFGEASDRRAAETAARENASLGEGEDSTLDAIMKSLTLDYKLNESITFAHLTRKSFKDTLGRRYRFTDLGVKTAPFFVLVRANMPSILAEVSFITNSVEERRLKSAAYRQKIAESLFDGIRDYIASSQITS